MNFFARLFKPKEKPTTELIRIPNGQFTSWNGNAYESDLFRSAVDAIARNAAKLKATLVSSANGELEKILQISPNPYMTTYDFQYKLITQLFLTNNAFALPPLLRFLSFAGNYQDATAAQSITVGDKIANHGKRLFFG